MQTYFPNLFSAWQAALDERPDNILYKIPVAQAEKYTVYTNSIFYRRAVRVSLALLDELRLREGDRVAVLCDAPHDLAMLVHGVLMARLVLVPVDFSFNDEVIISQLNESKAKVVIFPLEFAARIAGIFGKTPGVEHWVVSGGGIGRVGNTPVKKLDQLLARAAGVNLDITQSAERDCMALIISNKGTIQSPKFVAFTQSQVMHAISSACSIYPKTDIENENTWCILPRKLFNGLLHAFLVPLINDIPSILNLDFEFKRFWDYVLADEITYVCLEQAQLRAIGKRGKSRTWRQPQKFKMALFSTTALSGELISNFENRYGADIIPSYYSTEAGGIICAFRPGLEAAQKTKWLYEHTIPASGTPLSDLEIKIVDSDGTAIEGDRAGSILVKGPQVMKGYVGARGVAELENDGFLDTGDRGFFFRDFGVDGKRYLTVLGRESDIFERDSQPISPSLIDNLLYEINGVEYALAVGFPNVNTGYEVGAFVCISRASNLTEGDIITSLRKKLSGAECPKVIILGDKPKNPAGMTRKEALKFFDRYYDTYFTTNA